MDEEGIVDDEEDDNDVTKYLSYDFFVFALVCLLVLCLGLFV